MTFSNCIFAPRRPPSRGPQYI